MSQQLLHYDCLSIFKQQFYKDVLLNEHVIGGEIHINKIKLPDGSENESFNFWGYLLEKNGLKYLLPSRDNKDKERKLASVLPIIPKDLLKIAWRGQVYYIIQRPVSVKFKPEKFHNMRALVNLLDGFDHTNHTHRKLMIMMTLSQLLLRANYRISSPPGFGKDSIIDTCGALFGSAATIENPTIAKLEYMTHTKLLAVNEIVDIQKSEWRNIEQFLLSAGAHKPELTKHSRSISSETKEIIDISHFSLSLMYNDIDQYPNPEKYVDFATKKAVLDRFPAFRLYGVFQEDFNSANKINIKDFVKENFEDYKHLIYSFTYYKKHLHTELSHYNSESLIKMPQRWKTNIGRLLKIVDLYSKNQTEYNSWIQTINDSLKDYQAMIEFPKAEKQSKKTGGHDKKLMEAYKHFTFTERNKVLRGQNSNPVEDITFWN